jgi:hypothetical protein
MRIWLMVWTGILLTLADRWLYHAAPWPWRTARWYGRLPGGGALVYLIGRYYRIVDLRDIVQEG